MSDTALSYEEPDIILILTQSSFLILLNVLGSVIDHYLYCGLIAQILLGIAWGKPGGDLLADDFQKVVTQIGYLGLIAIIFEGGLSTSPKAVQKNLILSTCVALTGILVPLGLSYSLLSFASSTNLQAFAAGAALCSTSLGTTFNVLKTTGLSSTRLGVVLTSAAMLDDVVGLIMVQIISNLGLNSGPFQPSIVVRPVFVSIGFAVVLILVCKYIYRPIMGYLAVRKLVTKLLEMSTIYFLVCTAFLLALITSASYAGTSVLFATYLAGASLSWMGTLHVLWDMTAQQPNSETLTSPDTSSIARILSSPVSKVNQQSSSGRQEGRSDESPLQPSIELRDQTRQQATPPPDDDSPVTVHARAIPSNKVEDSHAAQDNHGLRMYNRFYAPAVDHILKPFFFVCPPKSCDTIHRSIS
ncbi:hypothetical protein LTR84_007095 [Exophiala bonariae]|uniref:Cation/H+ exchanger transmembrane domain-containing protein n=1 Tax=Exophiala bonariae TaxID=1690606 RepID=A0AAV9N3C9_9EURO|nr:hypothetical protein LTR84_007095 [Exophiala bonariae]